MTDPETQPAYRFRWSNYDLERYLDDMHQRAVILRRDAAMLTLKADVIDEERDKLRHALQEVEVP